MEILLKTKTFTDGSVAMATSHQPNQLVAFDVLLRQPDATAAFEELLRRAQPEGQVYGLCGLYLCDRTKFDELASRLSASTEKVDIWSGCTTHSRDLGDVVLTSWKGRIELMPDQTIDDWFDRHPGISAEFDVAGGSYPQSLLRYIRLWKGYEASAAKDLFRWTE